MSYVMNALVGQGRNVLVGGNSGVGKTVIIQDFLDKLCGNEESSYVSSSTMLSAQTTSGNLLDFFEDKLDKRRKNLLGPPSGKRMLMLVDDLNMPAKEVYGAQPPIELLRQVIDNGGYYDCKKLFFKNVVETQFIAACAPPGGGRSEVTPRLIRHFHMLNVTDLSEQSMKTIFSSILEGFLSVFSSECQEVVEAMVDGSIELYGRMKGEMLPTPSKSHYTFNLRDLSKVVQGITQVTPAKISKKDELAKVWCHEASRVFRDRLVDVKDRAWFDDVLMQQLHRRFGLQWYPEDFNDLLFGDYLSKGDKTYELVFDKNRLAKVLKDCAEDYSVVHNKPMDLVFFNDAMNHLSRVCRIIRQPRGNGLLVGVGGSGRQSLTRLAAHMADYR